MPAILDRCLSISSTLTISNPHEFAEPLAFAAEKDSPNQVISPQKLKDTIRRRWPGAWPQTDPFTVDLRHVEAD